jgi:hypothetical protein
VNFDRWSSIKEEGKFCTKKKQQVRMKNHGHQIMEVFFGGGLLLIRLEISYQMMCFYIISHNITLLHKRNSKTAFLIMNIRFLEDCKLNSPTLFTSIFGEWWGSNDYYSVIIWTHKPTWDERLGASLFKSWSWTNSLVMTLNCSWVDWTMYVWMGGCSCCCLLLIIHLSIHPSHIMTSGIEVQ